MYLVTALERRTVRPQHGTETAVWASAYSEVGDDYIFGALVDANEEKQAALEVTAHTPSNPRRVEVALLRVPRVQVASPALTDADRQASGWG